MYKVTFKFENSEDVIVFAALGENLLEVARKTNVAIDAPCNGNAACGKCKVRLLGGELDSKKTHHITDEEYAGGWRLACCSKICADVEIMVPDIASAYKSRMKVADLSSPDEIKIFDDLKKQVTEAGITLKNDMKIVSLKMSEPTLDDTMPDNERFTRALRAQTGVNVIRISYTALNKLAFVLRKSQFEIQVVLRETAKDLFVYDVFEKEKNVIVGGMAVDIGTTTVSAIIIDMLTGEILAKGSAGNGQIRYGADVINRIIESEKPGGREKLQKAVIDETINPLIDTMCRQAHLDHSQIYRLCIASNTTMNHLLLGVFADPVRMEPFVPSFFKTNSVYAYNIGINVNQDAHIIDIIAELFRCKIISPKGKFIREGKRVRHDEHGMGSYVIAFQEDAGSVKDVEITEVDIDSFIRAKGAIFSAIRTMLSYCDFDVSMIEHVYVAGGIGSGINMQNAIRIGMFPDVPLELYEYIGNSSLVGAYAMLYSNEAERKVYEIAQNMTYIELSNINSYMDEFVGACFLPHTDSALFPSIV